MEISAKSGRKAIAFIGLGRMGEAMAANIQRAGYPLVVWNRTPAKAEPLLAAGAAIATATNASANQIAIHARGVDCRAASRAAPSAVIPIVTPPQPGTAVNSAADSIVSRI